MLGAVRRCYTWSIGYKRGNEGHPACSITTTFFGSYPTHPTPLLDKSGIGTCPLLIASKQMTNELYEYVSTMLLCCQALHAAAVIDAGSRRKTRALSAWATVETALSQANMQGRLASGGVRCQIQQLQMVLQGNAAMCFPPRRSCQDPVKRS